MKQKVPRRRIDVNVEELDRIIDGGKSAPLSESDSEKLKTALHALAERLLPRAKTEKTNSVFEDFRAEKDPGGRETDPPRVHGRNGADAYRGAAKVEIAHGKLAHGDRCPDCARGNVYTQKEPKALVRIVGQAPLAATVYSLERLRCGSCGQVFTAQEPEGVGPEKYDGTAAAMIAQLKYGSGVPFYRLEKMEDLLGIPLPAATQWELVEENAEVVKPAHQELIRQAAQGEVLHNDDTGMRVLQMEREPSDERTGVFTSGIVSIGSGRKIALYFTGRQHAGENLGDVLKQRAAGLNAPIQMCDALSRNTPKLSPGVEILLAGDNFGCGSSREHAPWALTQFGFRAVISTSFADIFKGNSLKNSLLPIVVPADVHAALFAAVEADPNVQVTVDLVSQTLTLPDGKQISFAVDEFSKQCLLEGVDELGYILKQEPAIAAFEAKRIGTLNTLQA